MKKLPDDLLMESYAIAIDLQLNPEFILLLETEIRRRSLAI